MDNPFLFKEFRDVDILFALVRYMVTDVVVNVYVMMAVLLRHDRNLNMLIHLSGLQVRIAEVEELGSESSSFKQVYGTAPR